MGVGFAIRPGTSALIHTSRGIVKTLHGITSLSDLLVAGTARNLVARAPVGVATGDCLCDGAESIADYAVCVPGNGCQGRWCELRFGSRW